MKKTVIMILAVLPIVLLVVIAFAGQILSMYQNIPVEKVEFVDRLGTAYNESIAFKVNEGSERETMIRIYPDLATNKKVSYTSSDESICTVDSNGVIKGEHYGITTVIVKTDDGGKIAMLTVEVKSDIPSDITLSAKELTLKVGQKSSFSWIVDAPVSINKSVTFSSSNTSVVKVDNSGNVTAVGAGTAIVTVTTVSGGVTDSCIVTVEEGRPPISFDFESNDSLVLVNAEDDIWKTDESVIDFGELIVLDDTVDLENLVIAVEGSNSATVSDGVITFTAPAMITVIAYDSEHPEVLERITLVYDP